MILINYDLIRHAIKVDKPEEATAAAKIKRKKFSDQFIIISHETHQNQYLSPCIHLFFFSPPIPLLNALASPSSNNNKKVSTHIYYHFVLPYNLLPNQPDIKSK